jgi:hypothetical protein
MPDAHAEPVEAETRDQHFFRERIGGQDIERPDILQGSQGSRMVSSGRV